MPLAYSIVKLILFTVLLHCYFRNKGRVLPLIRKEFQVHDKEYMGILNNNIARKNDSLHWIELDEVDYYRTSASVSISVTRAAATATPSTATPSCTTTSTCCRDRSTAIILPSTACFDSSSKRPESGFQSSQF